MKKLMLVAVILLTMVSISFAGTWAKALQLHFDDEATVLVGYKSDLDTYGWPDTITFDVVLWVYHYNHGGLGTTEPYTLEYKDSYKETVTLSVDEETRLSFDWKDRGCNGRVDFTIKVENGEGGEMRDWGSTSKSLRF